MFGEERHLKWDVSDANLLERKERLASESKNIHVSKWRGLSGRERKVSLLYDA